MSLHLFHDGFPGPTNRRVATICEKCLEGNPGRDLVKDLRWISGISIGIPSPRSIPQEVQWLFLVPLKGGIGGI